MPRLDTKSFITKSRQRHGDRYNYSKANYINSVTKVTVICPEHGEFRQAPAEHLRGRGCRKCAIQARGQAKRISKREFVARARKVHGNRYDYSKVVYRTMTQKVTIICPEHGEFEQTPTNHLAGHECFRCKGSELKTTKSFVAEAKTIHGDKYDYSKVDYRGNHNKVVIICPIHGEWSQDPASHLRGHGCAICAGQGSLSASEFAAKASEIHGDKYDYSKIAYQGNQKLVEIICPTHGPFRQKAYDHLRGIGCQGCAGNVKIDTPAFIERARNVHGDKYDYSEVRYKGNKVKVRIVCPEHGPFLQVPTSHLRGFGCAACSGFRGFQTDKPANLYYLKIISPAQILYKVGITNLDVATRVSTIISPNVSIEILSTWRFDLGITAWQREQSILQNFRSLRYSGPDVIASGNTELFTKDVLGLDSESA